METLWGHQCRLPVLSRWTGLVLLASLISGGCGKSSPHPQPDKLQVTGHGGMGIEHHYPMNSFESVYQCLHLQPDGVEIDIQLTADTVIVLYHSHDLSVRTNCSGYVHEKSLKELLACQYGDPMPHRTYPMISLRTLWEQLPERHNYIFILDCKTYYEVPHAVFIEALVELIDEFGMREQVRIESTQRPFLCYFQENYPGYALYAYQSFEAGYALATAKNLAGITLDVTAITPEQVRKAQDAGLKVSVINTHTRRRNRLALKMGVDIIQTDKLRYLLRQAR